MGNLAYTDAMLQTGADVLKSREKRSDAGSVLVGIVRWKNQSS